MDQGDASPAARAAVSVRGGFLLTVPCAVCGSPATATYSRIEQYDVLRCMGCQTQFLHPQPTDARLAEIYTETYFFARDSRADRERFTRLKSASARRTLSLLPAPTPGARLLDVGCGAGDFLAEAESFGYEVTGVEYSESSAALARSRVKGSVLQGSLESAAFPDRSFDVVANTDVIEHVRDPAAFAREMARVLAPGGVAVVTTPSTSSWSARLLRRHWMEYKVEHLFYFNPASLAVLLRAAGFQRLAFRPNVKILSLDYVASHFERFPVPVVAPLVVGLRGVTPQPIRHLPIPIVASGTTALAFL